MENRVQLHVHFDGSFDVEFLFKILQLRGISLPGFGTPSDVEELWEFFNSFYPRGKLNNVFSFVFTKS